MAVELAVTGAAAAAAGGGGDKAAGASSSDSDVNDSDLDSDSEGEHEELRAVVDRMMKEESDEDDDGGVEAPRCVVGFVFVGGERASAKSKSKLKCSAPARSRARFLPHFTKKHSQRCRGTRVAPAKAFGRRHRGGRRS